jgi:hypothetical protein
MNITVHVKLEGEKARELMKKARVHQTTRNAAMETLKKSSGCDEVLVSRSFGRTDLHLGFKTKQDDPIYHKKKEYAAGHYIHTCKRGEIASSIEWAVILANSTPDLDTVVAAEFLEFLGEVKESSRRGFTIRRASFGGEGSLIFGAIPYKKEFVMPKGWVEIGALEFARLTGQDDE